MCSASRRSGRAKAHASMPISCALKLPPRRGALAAAMRSKSAGCGCDAVANAHARLARCRGSHRGLAHASAAALAIASKSPRAAGASAPMACAAPCAMLARMSGRWQPCASSWDWVAAASPARLSPISPEAVCHLRWRPSLFHRFPRCIASIRSPCCACSCSRARADCAFEIQALRSGGSGQDAPPLCLRTGAGMRWPSDLRAQRTARAARRAAQSGAKITRAALRVTMVGVVPQPDRRWHEDCSENRREPAKRDRKRQTPEGGRRLATHSSP